MSLQNRHSVGYSHDFAFCQALWEVIKDLTVHVLSGDLYEPNTCLAMYADQQVANMKRRLQLCLQQINLRQTCHYVVIT